MNTACALGATLVALLNIGMYCFTQHAFPASSCRAQLAKSIASMGLRASCLSIVYV
jgi:hypothetical protein